ncbi:MAG TPA: pentapeptide repeat-containing protein [bacterium]
MGPTTRWISTILGTIGGLAGALIGLFIWLLGRSLSNKITKTQDAKLLQDKELNREQHNLQLFKSLGDENPRTQLAAASVLVQRLMYFRKQKKSNLLSETEYLELPTIIHVLIAVTKEKISDRRYELILNKYIADNLVIALDAIVPINQEPDENKPSPLHRIDFQKSQLVNVWWERIDARDVDFFEADLRKAGLEGAFLMDTVFLCASLEGCVLRKANLTGADLRRANLKGTDLRGAILKNTKLDGAEYDLNTKWPDNFQIKDTGAVLV